MKYDSILARLGYGLSIRLMTITPDVASQWLTKNHKLNRRAAPSRVRQYTADMGAKRWELSDQTITFDTNGELINGQKRLRACVDSGEPFPSLVLYGLPTKSMLVLDGAQRRTTDDNIRMDGREWPKGCGSTVRRAMLGARKFSGRAVTDAEVVEFMEAYGEAVSFAHRVLAKGKTATASTRAPLVRAHIGKADQRGLESFARVLTTGLMLPGEEQAVLLRNRILEADHSGGGSRADLYLATESAISAFLAGQRLTKILPNTKELYPIPGESKWFSED